MICNASNESYLFGISEKISVTHFSNVSSVSKKERRKTEMQFPEDLRQVTLSHQFSYLKEAASQCTWKLQSSKL